MTKSKKYAYHIEQDNSSWKAQITRQVSSKKTIISKEQGDFASEAQALEWAEQELLAFASTLGKSNQRHGEQRKHLEDVRRQRSNRRADKTQQAKKDAEPETDKILDEED